jgi:Tfp pilus assembly protein FimT
MPLIKKYQKQNQRQFSGGFGLVELMVSIGIITLVISIVIVRNDAYNASILLKSEAFEVALQIRETQMLAVSAIGQGVEFRNQHGLAFTTGRNYYETFTFKDTNGNNIIDTSEKTSHRVNLGPRFQIDQIRLISGSVTTPTPLSILFERPNFDAKFYSGSSFNSSAEKVEIDVRRVGTTGDGLGKVRTVEVLRTGQVSVQ